MKSLFARWCGHQDRLNTLHQEIADADRRVTDLERRLDRSRILREDAERRLHETSTDLIRTRKQRDDLTELLEAQEERSRVQSILIQNSEEHLNRIDETIPAVIDLLINAKRFSGLNHSGPALARDRIDQAITLLRGAQ